MVDQFEGMSIFSTIADASTFSDRKVESGFICLIRTKTRFVGLSK